MFYLIEFDSQVFSGFYKDFFLKIGNAVSFMVRHDLVYFSMDWNGLVCFCVVWYGLICFFIVTTHKTQS